ncbi:MAG: cbb3-type cytochrome c oxidase subunit I [Verrucomicrobiota bacterium]
MSSLASTTHLSESNAAPELTETDRSNIDQSLRLPVLFLFASATGWLLLAILFGFIASIKLHSPEFIGNLSWLTYGRIWPAYLDCFVYGWAIPSGLGAALWVIARVTGVALGRPLVPAIAALVWNIGVAAGILEILAGNSQGFEFFEFPRYVAVILFISYALIASWAAVMMHEGASVKDSVSCWYFSAAFIWFPWLLGAAYLMLTVTHVPGVMQGLVGAWFAQNLIGLWFVSVGLGVIYYLIPKVTGRPIFSRQLASLGFWSFALFWGWTSATRYTGGPLPVWLITVGIGSSILMLIPVAAVAANFALSLRGNFQKIASEPSIRFAGFSAVAWVVASILAIFTSLRSVDHVTHFTQVSIGETHLFIFAFYTMAIFGAMYYIIPRLLGREWLSASFIQMHFWGSAYGIGLMVFLLLVGGVSQGLAWNDPANYKSAVDVTDAFMSFLRVSGLAWLLLISSSMVFAMHFLIMMVGLGNQNYEPVSLAHDEEEAKS